MVDGVARVAIPQFTVDIGQERKEWQDVLTVSE
jgi:hypothetical protein